MATSGERDNKDLKDMSEAELRELRKELYAEKGHHAIWAEETFDEIVDLKKRLSKYRKEKGNLEKKLWIKPKSNREFVKEGNRWDRLDKIDELIYDCQFIVEEKEDEWKKRVKGVKDTYERILELEEHIVSRACNGTL